MALRFSRVVRTPYSEVYHIWNGEQRVGQFDVHYGTSTAYGTLILEVELDEEAEQQLVAQLDAEVVSSCMPDVVREDFQVTVFRGREISSYNDDEDILPDLEDEF